MKITNEGAWLGTFSATVFCAMTHADNGEPLFVSVIYQDSPEGPTEVRGVLTGFDQTLDTLEVDGHTVDVSDVSSFELCP